LPCFGGTFGEASADYLGRCESGEKVVRVLRIGEEKGESGLVDGFLPVSLFSHSEQGKRLAYAAVG
jgi:hypothetical protein